MGKPVKIPKTPGAVCDRIYAIRAEKKIPRDALNALDEEEKALIQHLIDTCPMSDPCGGGKNAKFEILVAQEPTVQDRAALEAFILKTKDFSLLQAGLSKPAIKERWGLKQQVPGVGVYQYKKVSVTKR